MKMYKVTSPVLDFTGISVEVPFANGVATVNGDIHGAALRYFRQAGYGVEKIDDEPVVEDVASHEGSDGGEGGEGGEGKPPPARSASKAEWKAYAVGRGMTEAEAENTTRDQLAARFTEGGAS